MTSISAQPRSGAGPYAAPSVFATLARYRHLLPLIALLYAALVPLEIRLSFAGQNLYPTRVVGFLAMLVVVRSIIGRRFPFRKSELIFYFAASWMIVSFVVYYGPIEGFPRSLALVIDVVFPYMIARNSVRTLTDLRVCLIIFAPGALISGISMAIESISHRPFVRPLASSIFSPLPRYEGGVAVEQYDKAREIRLGLLRATGPFSHPILAGVFMGSLWMLYASSGLRGRPKIAGIIAGCLAVFSLSTAGFLALFLGFAMTAYDRVQKFVQFLNWRAGVVAVAVFSLVIELASTKGIAGLAGRIALDGQTAYYRTLIWEYGLKSVFKHPWFGIGFDPFERLSWMVSSVDAYWLALAIRHGVPTALGFLASTVLAIYLLSIRAWRAEDETDRRTYVALAGTLFAIAFLAFTVALFGGIVAWFFALLAVGFSLSESSPTGLKARLA